MWELEISHFRERINRNIVECKCINETSKLVFLLELIETLWNVNEIKVKARLTDDKN